MIRIGVSPRLLHPQPGARGVHTKILHYVEDGIAQWLQSRDALLFVLPLSERAADYAQALDGLVLQGGADISPLVYGEEAQKPEWAGDPMRDAYEIALVQAFTVASKPVHTRFSPARTCGGLSKCSVISSRLTSIRVRKIFSSGISCVSKRSSNS